MVRFRPLPWLTLAAFPALALLLGLGSWQLQRLEWKLALISQIEARASAPIQPIDDVIANAAKPGDLNFWHVEAIGQLDHLNEFHLYSRNAQGRPGYRVIAPLLRDRKRTVLVDRGFVPEANKAAQTRAQGQTTGTVTIAGIARTYEPPGPFMPDNQPADNMWYFVDIDGMSAQLGVSDILPLVLEADDAPNPGGLPLGGQSRLTLTNDHLGYAITWYGLAATLLGVYFAFHKSHGRLAFGVAASARDG